MPYTVLKPCIGRGQPADALSAGTTNTEHNVQLQLAFPRATTNVRLLFSNFYQPGSGATDDSLTSSGPIVVRAHFFRCQSYVTFGGVSSVTIQPGGFVWSDPIPYQFFPGEKNVLRIYVTNGVGTKIPISITTVSADSEGASFSVLGVIGDLTASGTITSSNTQCYAPTAIVGTIENWPTVPSFALVGDSITRGSGDTTIPNDGGYAVRLCRNLFVPWHRAAAGGDSATSLTLFGALPTTKTNGNQYTYMRDTALLGCTHALVLYGSNDFATLGNTLAQVQQAVIFRWRQLNTFIPYVIPVTFPPRGTSAGNNTPLNANFAAGTSSPRALFNAWLLDGAPITITLASGIPTFTPAATGISAATANVVRAGGTVNGYLHPCAFYAMDINRTLESGPNTGIYNPSYTADNVHPNSVGAQAVADDFTATYPTYFVLSQASAGTGGGSIFLSMNMNI